MCQISDKLELLNICLENANNTFDNSIPDDHYRSITEDVNSITEAGYDHLLTLAHTFFKSEDIRNYNIDCKGFIGASYVAYCCGLLQYDPLLSSDDIPVFPELFYSFYQNRKRLPLFISIGTISENVISKSEFHHELLKTKKWEIKTDQSLCMLDRLESEIGYKDHSLQNEESTSGASWLNAYRKYGLPDFIKRISSLFPDFIPNTPSAIEFLARILENKIPFTRKNLSRILGILHGEGTIQNAMRMLDSGISFEDDHAGEFYIAYPEDIYGYIHGKIPTDDAIRITQKICLNREDPAFEDMNTLIAGGIPTDYIRRIWQINHMYSSTQCFSNARKIIRLSWYYENHQEDYIRMFCKRNGGIIL